MKTKPVILVQLVHIEGPLKGEIQEFSQSTINIGRHPSCHVQFPIDMAIISRQHASIVREGNRFKFIDRSTNGTFVNGKKVKEVLLKDGDVLIFAEGGPKLSFLTQVTGERQEEAEEEEYRQSAVDTSKKTRHTEPIRNEKPAHEKPAPPPKPKVTPERVKAPLVIQFGPTLRSYNELPVVIGNGQHCDFMLDHPALLERHAQVFFSQDEYWIKDLTGKKLVCINDQPIDVQSKLLPDNQLSLTPKGPNFQFLGGGRLAEIEKPSEEELNATDTLDTANDEPKKKKSIFKKFLGR